MSVDGSTFSLPPMAELHCHLEGTVSPAMAIKLGARHGMDLQGLLDAHGAYAWDNFHEFLASYDAMAKAIQTPEDYFDITYDYYAAMARRGLIYGESFVSPDHGQYHGLSYPTLIDAISAAMQKAEADFGITARIILIAVRHYGVERAKAVAELAHRHPHPMVVGFGMGGDEHYLHPADFKQAFACASDAGLGLTCHAGEAMGPESIKATIDALHVSRIGHGVRAIEDPALMDDLRDKGIVLELCPGSNVALGVYPERSAHPLAALIQSGLKITLNSDDPPFFHTDIEQEYRNASLYEGLDGDDLRQLTRQAISAAFCDDETKQSLLNTIAEPQKS
ncbi:adenosine deaminase [Iodidimonas sp. MBR-14]|uniref:adenosine deaminase n=1 Tax=Iodidimonas sp. MBR-14 TaxID=3032319 RepID=UPI002483144B|nr:adenosine deaminase [Iodidimonas sp. MBR-14]